MINGTERSIKYKEHGQQWRIKKIQNENETEMEENDNQLLKTRNTTKEISNKLKYNKQQQTSM